MTFAIQADQVVVNFASGRALDAVSLTLGKGEFVALVGPNGSGKTTLLRVLAANLRPDHGTVYLSGRDLRSWKSSEMARHLASVPQRLPAEFAFRVCEVVAMGRYPHRTGPLRVDPQGDEAVSAALEATGLTEFAERPVTELSGGEWQRVVIAQALAQEPKILLLDEPTAHLDLTNQVHLLELIRGLNRERGLTVCAVLHDLNLAARYCDRIVVLARGKVCAAGTPTEVFTPGLLGEVFRTELTVSHDETTGRPVVMPRGTRLDGHSAQGDARPGENHQRLDQRIQANQGDRHDDDPGAPDPGTLGSGALASGTPSPRLFQGLTVHVICGGGSGSELLRELWAGGASVTAGALNRLDTDWEVARSLGIPVAEEAPFSHLGGEALSATRAYAGAAEVVVLACLPFGQGNLANLQVAEDALRQGKPVIMCDYAPIAERDFTGGEAAGIYQRILAGGGRRVVSPAELRGALGERITRKEEQEKL